MKIAGIQKLTLLDFPGRLAATIFTPGCNLRCPFCHNASLVDPAELKVTMEETGLLDPDEILAFLKERFGKLTGLAVTGGEPLMQPGIMEFLRKVKELGYAVKLDTNGTNPERLRALLTAGIVDYVAMDLKNCREKYALTTGLPESSVGILYESTLLSARFIRESGVQHEFRTTVVAQLHTVDDIRAIAREFAGAPAYFLQSFADSGDILGSGGDYNSLPEEKKFTAASREIMKEMQKAAQEFIPNTQLRGI